MMQSQKRPVENSHYNTMETKKVKVDWDGDVHCSTTWREVECCSILWTKDRGAMSKILTRTWATSQIPTLPGIVDEEERLCTFKIPIKKQISVANHVGGYGEDIWWIVQVRPVTKDSEQWKPLQPTSHTSPLLLASSNPKRQTASLVLADNTRVAFDERCLTEASEYFEKMLDSDMKEGQDHTISVHHYPIETVQAMLEFLSKGSLPPLPDETLANLAVLADHYAIPSLVKACSQEISTRLTLERIRYFVGLASNPSYKTLATTLTRVVMAHHETLLQRIMQFDPCLLVPFLLPDSKAERKPHAKTQPKPKALDNTEEEEEIADEPFKSRIKPFPPAKSQAETQPKPKALDNAEEEEEPASKAEKKPQAKTQPKPKALDNTEEEEEPVKKKCRTTPFPPAKPRSTPKKKKPLDYDPSSCFD
jgi:hypothetical protein